MRKYLAVGAALLVSAGTLMACSGDDNATPAPDGGASKDGGASGDATVEGGSSDGSMAHDGAGEASTGDGAASSDAGDGASDAGDATYDSGDAGSDAAAPERLLLSFNGSTSSELVAFNVATKQVDGRLTYPGFIGTTSTYRSPDPYLMEQANDVVAKLDRNQPWVIKSSWSMKLSDQQDGGASYSDPDGVVVAAGSKAYVLRYTRNEIAIVDTSQTADAGAPTGTIDLKSFVQAGDGDGIVEMSGGIYVPEKKLVYVLLANINRKNVAPDGFTILCSATRPTIIAIDPQTDAVVPLVGGNAQGAIEVSGGFGPLFGGGFAYDAASDRLIVVTSGCNQPDADGGAGPIAQREIDAVSLFTGATTQLYDANAMGFPGGFVLIDSHRAIVQYSAPDFSSTSTYVWDPSSTQLGGAIPNAPDAFVYDGQDNLLGLSAAPIDGGTRYDVVSVRIADGKKTVLGSNPFSLATGFVGGVDLWPHP